MDSENGVAKSEMESQVMSWEMPKKQGLYDPLNEHEACGVGFIVAIDGRRSHKVCKVQSRGVSNSQLMGLIICRSFAMLKRWPKE